MCYNTSAFLQKYFLEGYMTKETLTLINIKKDLKRHYQLKLRDLLIVSPFIPLTYFLIFKVFLLFCNPNYNFKIIYSIIFYGIFFLAILYELVTIIIGFSSIKKEKIEISSDWIVDKKHRVYGSRVSDPKPYRFVFAKSGIYNIPYGENYRWSPTFTISDKNLYEHTTINDEFYLISIGRQKNIIAYSKKYFEIT